MVQLLPEQQGWPTVPHGWHWLFEPHTVPVPHGVLVGQHGWFAPPHGWHMPAEQMAPGAVHVLCEQQGWPTPPQPTQLVPEHVTPGAVHEPEQHICEIAPQLPQLPMVHVPPSGAQVAPVAAQ